MEEKLKNGNLFEVLNVAMFSNFITRLLIKKDKHQSSLNKNMPKLLSESNFSIWQAYFETFVFNEIRYENNFFEKVVKNATPG